MTVKHKVILEVDEALLQAVLDIVDNPSEAYPEAGDAQDFFEVHWDMFETIAAKAKEIGLIVDCNGCGRCPQCDEDEDVEDDDYDSDDDDEEDEDDEGCDLCSCIECECEPEQDGDRT